LSSGDIVVLTEPPVRGADADSVGEDDCWAYAWILLQIPKSNTPTRTENTAKIELVWFILNYTEVILLFIRTNYKLSSFLYYYYVGMNTRKEL
jgi:hypothetical protein